jgi:hypothetical protein
MILLPLTGLFEALQSFLSRAHGPAKPAEADDPHDETDALSRLGGGSPEALLYLYGTLTRRP